jgi:prepilin-type N-terminal cleavage/methylation domain-containing protein
MNRSAFTLLETLLALALLAMLAAAAVSWTTSSQTLAIEVSNRAEREAVVAAALRQLRDDLATFDADDLGAPPLTLSPFELSFVTRHPSTGSASVVYRLDERLGTLTRTIAGADAEALVDDLMDVRMEPVASPADSDEDAPATALGIVLVFTDGSEIETALDALAREIAP